MKYSDKLIFASILALSSTSVGASMIVFDDAANPNYQLSSTGIAGAPEAFGGTLTYSDFTVTGGVALSNVLTGSGFSKSDIKRSSVAQDAATSGGGLGVCSEDRSCSGVSGSLSSNINPGSNPGSDEVLFFDFLTDTSLETVFFNGLQGDQVNGDLVGNYKDLSNALYNVFFSADGSSYQSIFGGSGQQQPTDLDFFNISNVGAYGHWAVAASGWGDHAGYVEAIKYNSVPEPSTLALIGLGLAGLGLSRRRNRSKAS